MFVCYLLLKNPLFHNYLLFFFFYQILKPMMLRRLKEDVEKNLAAKEETIIEVCIGIGSDVKYFFSLIKVLPWENPFKEKYEVSISSSLFVSPEARHRYCFSGVIGGGVGDVNFCRVVWFSCFSGTIRARLMKHGTAIHLVEGS